MARITLLGTGTSQGVPVIGCDCDVCRSADPHDSRLRCSVLIRSETTSVVIDTGPDFRQQMLRADNRQLDAVLLTHEHNDHVAGLDDVRPYNFMQWHDLPVYALPRVCDAVRSRFPYIFSAEKYPGAPMVDLHPIGRKDPILIGDLEFIPIKIFHGNLPILGFRIGNFAYLTDMKSIPREEEEKLHGLDDLVVNALHHRQHHSHLNLEEAMEFIQRLSPGQAWLTHISHHMGLQHEVEASLPSHIRLAYDGLELQA